MEIREATSADFDTIDALYARVSPNHERSEFIDRVLRSPTCLVAEQNGAVLGCAALNYTFYGNGFIPSLYIAESARRLGIGRALMKALELRCKTRKLFTSTNQSNEPMQALLKVLGYVPSGVIHNLDLGDPEVIYFLNLDEHAT